MTAPSHPHPLRVVAGLHLDGGALTELDARPAGHAELGLLVAGPRRLLTDLELRLGLATPEVPAALRHARWSSRMAKLAPLGRFYTHSYATDPIGTSIELLSWRDALIEAGWTGAFIADAGPRLDALFELESLGEPPLPPSGGDRLRRILSALSSYAPYSELALHEPLSLWPALWRRLFAKLARLGCNVTEVIPAFEGAPRDCDLRRLQDQLDGHAIRPFEGDGTFVVLRAGSSWEAAGITASILASSSPDDTAVIRSGESYALDAALASQGSAPLGVASVSAWRPALQALPLALELAYAPKDPRRVLELLTLPIGPFQGVVGRRLAEAIAKAPGLKSGAWSQAMLALEELANDSEPARRERLRVELERVATWIETPGAARAATRAALSDIVALVQRWIGGRLQQGDARGTLVTALAHARAVSDALACDPRESLDIIALRKLVDAATKGGAALRSSPEGAGRHDHVSSPHALLAPRANVLFWHFVRGTEEAPRRSPWRHHEASALAAAGVKLLPPTPLLAHDARIWRRGVMAASERLVLVIVEHARGEVLVPHPLWDEIVAGREGMERVTVTTASALAGRTTLLNGAVRIEQLARLALPPARPIWTLPARTIPRYEKLSASGLEAYLGCPLKWVMSSPGGVSDRASLSVPEGVRLFGILGHRLIEELAREGALELGSEPLRARALAVFDDLVTTEASILLMPGMAGELTKLRQQLAHAVIELIESLRQAGMRVVGVEHEASASCHDRQLSGRIDMLLADDGGRPAIVDLKWGSSTARKRLASGRALQLAVYARICGDGKSELPPAAYFSLAAAQMLAPLGSPFTRAEAVEGPELIEIWRRARATVEIVEDMLDAGQIAVTGTRRALPLLQHAGSDEAAIEASLLPPEPGAACTYCDYAAICGARWETFA